MASWSTSEASPPDQPTSLISRGIFKKMRGGLLLTLGFLLSPLSWWNDLVFNLPVAYGIGYLCNRVFPETLLPATIFGYWVSNILGILLMQAGVLDLRSAPSRPHNRRQELLTGCLSATAYTGLIFGLVQFKVLETPILLLTEQFPQLTALLPR